MISHVDNYTSLVINFVIGKFSEPFQIIQTKHALNNNFLLVGNLDDYKSETKLIFPKLSALQEFISKLMSREITPGNKNVQNFTDQAVKSKKNSKI